MGAIANALGNARIAVGKRADREGSLVGDGKGDVQERPDPDALLQRLQDEECSQPEGRPCGRLKVFFGYAAGVGKTYAMLQEAHRAQESGTDVAVGYVEPHSRPDTLALLEGLEVLPPKRQRHRGIELREFDLDAALERHPQVVLVDELAHSNAPGLSPSASATKTWSELSARRA